MDYYYSRMLERQESRVGESNSAELENEFLKLPPLQ
jgi:hypothetical protein